MSSISSQELAASASDSKEPGCEPLASVRSTHSPAACSPSTGRTYPATKMSPPESSLRAKPTSSAEASPVRTSVMQVTAPDLPASVRDSGGNCYEPFAWYDRSTRSWRTWQRCLVEGWELFSETWPRSGRTRNGIAYRREPLVPLTSVTGSGSLLPTPRAEDMDSMGSGKHSKDSLIIQARTWPTPTAVEGRRGNKPPRPWDTGIPLAQAVAMWPNQSLAERQAKGQQIRLNTQVSPDGGAGGQLNPPWVEWLMGFPIGWTALKDWVTPSSRKSRKRSGELS